MNAWITPADILREFSAAVGNGLDVLKV